MSDAQVLYLQFCIGKKLQEQRHCPRRCVAHVTLARKLHGMLQDDSAEGFRRTKMIRQARTQRIENPHWMRNIDGDLALRSITMALEASVIGDEADRSMNGIGLSARKDG